MTLVSTAPPATLGEGVREALGVFVQKSHDACFIDWVVGCIFGYVLIVAPAMHWPSVGHAALWPAVSALGITRFGDAIKKAVTNYARAKYVEVTHARP